MTVDEMLSEARAVLTPRLAPAEAYSEMKRGVVLIDIRYLEQRVRDGEIPDAAIINRNEFEWRCDPSAPWCHEMINRNDYALLVVVRSEEHTSELQSR